jgi:hypothetical protein
MGLCLYGVRCGIEFTDVTPSRQERDVERLRAVVADLGEPASAPRRRVVVTGPRRAASPGTGRQAVWEEWSAEADVSPRSAPAVVAKVAPRRTRLQVLHSA